MKPGQTAYQADEELYLEATRDAFNLCCAWLHNSGHEQASFELAEYLNAGVKPIPAKAQISYPAPSDSLRTAAHILGYEGEACPECQNFTLVRNGTCLKCNTCGATTGCS